MLADKRHCGACAIDKFRHWGGSSAPILLRPLMVLTLRAGNGTGRLGEVNILEKSVGSSFNDLKESSCEPTEKR